MGGTSEKTNCIRISTTSVQKADETDKEAFTRYLPTEAANKHIREALHRHEATQDVEVVGVGTTKTGYVIRFRDEPSTQKARANE